MGEMLELTYEGEMKRAYFRDPESPEGEDWFQPRTTQDDVLNELAMRQPISESSFYQEMEELDVPYRRVRYALDKLIERGYVR